MVDVYGIKNVTGKQLNFNYDKFYREMGLQLKIAKTDDESNLIKKAKAKELEELLDNIYIDINILKCNFVNILKSEESSKYLWILYSKYENGENYIDKISNILKQENKIIRGGINTYKLNGWMTHSLYVYQIINYNIAYNKEIINFNGEKENIQQIKELYEIYNKLNKNSKFLLKIFALIHDIGVIEDVKFHDKLGAKYVTKVLDEIGIYNSNVSLDLKDFTKILQEVIKYHTLITSLSSESSDLYVQNEYKKLLEELPKSDFSYTIKKEIPQILLLLAYGDVIAVDESLMNIEKYKRIKECFNFFKQITYGEKTSRNKEMVAIERICDIVGENKIENLTMNFNYILNKYNIEKRQFIDDMYNIKLMRYTAPLMKTLKNTEMTIKILHELFELIGHFEGKEQLKDYTIIFLPDKHENDFVEQFNNNNFFECIVNMKKNNKNEFTYKNINIKTGINDNGKYLHIRVV